MRTHQILDRYLSGDLSEPNGDQFEEHLEICRPCRGRLPRGPELESARLAVMSRVVAGRPHDSRPGHWRGPLVAVAAAVVVIVLATPLLWLTDAGQETIDTPTELPLPPDTAASSKPFVLTFELQNGDVGWLLWGGESDWIATRLATVGAELTVRYTVGSRADGVLLNAGDESIIPSDDAEVTIALIDRGAIHLLTLDNEIPWELLMSSASPADKWNVLTDGAEMVATTSDSPLAASAAAFGPDVAAFSDGGLLVSWSGYEATSIEYRPLAPAELEPILGPLSADYAVYLAPRVSPQLRHVFRDGLITLAEYETAAKTAIACAESAGGSGSFSIPGAGEPASIELGKHVQCAVDTFEPVDALWRLQVGAYGPEDGNIVQAIIDGDDDQLAMLAAEPGPRIDLAAGDGWSIDVGARGEGWCVYSYATISSGEGCNLPAGWMVPGVLDVDLSEIIHGEEGLLGVTSDSISAVVVHFARGDAQRLETQGAEGAAIRGFGVVYEMDESGFPEIIDLYDRDGEHVQSFNLLDHVCSGDRGHARWCG